MGVVAHGDSLLVFDALLARFTIFDESYSVAGVFKADDPLVQGFVPFNARDLVVFFEVERSTSAAVLHHIVNGRTVRSFGPPSDGSEASFPLRLGHSSRGRLWVVPRNKYEVELWDTAGAVLRRYRGDRAWFGERSTSVSFTREPPNTSLDAVWEDSDGLLWLLFSTAAADWKAGEIRRGRSSVNVWADKFYDSRVEVVDPRTGELIAAQSFGNMLVAVAMTTPGLVRHRRGDRVGVGRRARGRACTETPRQGRDHSALSLGRI